ncbi:hypothetical protein I3F58_22850 [Streptomyces sp. MUM 203J]|uniref:hypothetical protein n=1 Tax=Streptomyces sp. MUM 203J TaxID=2791990 RepID=UPI001F036F1E|nr:hypothetical protein [Streptomyces sp. MUM 203J]MCH0542337.1 hypothetical protein [Streptomyces sp. MUM 203J]
MSQGTFRTTAVVTACEGAGCRRQEAAGRARRHAEQNTRLCSGCGHRFVAELKALPGLYEECGTLLAGSDQPRERTSGGPLPGMPFNTAAAEARSSVVGVLRSWAAMVLDDRFGGGRHAAAIRTPGTVAELAAFLVRHSDWLAAHDAAGEVSEEVARLVRRARRVIDPEPLRRVTIGACTKPDCSGGLTATVRPSHARFPAEITCDTDPAHRWLGHEWLQLSRLMAGQRGAESVREPGDSGNSPAEEVRWIAAGDIAALWGIAPGSVYRHASEHQWRRRSQGGRTYYHDADVRTTLEGRRRSR